MKFPDITRFSIVAVDTETAGRDWRDRPWRWGPVFGLAVSTPDGEDYYWDVRRTPEALDWARQEFPKVQRWCAHFAGFDWHMLQSAGVHLPMGPDRMDCTMIRAALIDEHRLTYDLDSLAADILGRRKDTDLYAVLAEMFGGPATRNAQIGNIAKAPVEVVAKYAKLDSRLCLDLWQWQVPEIDSQDLHSVLALEREVWGPLRRMERRGVRVDVDGAEKAIGRIHQQIKQKQRELDREAGFPVNPNPSGSIHKLFKPQQISDRAFRLVDGTIAPATPGGKASINGDVLQSMKHPAARMIIQLRQWKRMADTFIAGHILSNQRDGLVHTTFNQTKTDQESGTGTGRLSSTDPALQQIPGRDPEIAPVVRGLFLPDADQEWAAYDWDQFEFRMFAHYSAEPAVLAVYADNPDADYHQTIADLTDLPRKHTPGVKGNAKQINLGLVFGMGGGKMASEMGLPFYEEEGRNGRIYLKAGPETMEILDKYHSSVPGVKRYLKRAESVAKRRGYVKTIEGRHLRFPRGLGTHKAGGLILQGSSADAMKRKIIEIDEYLSDREADILLSVHDEVDLTVDPQDTETKEGVRLIQQAFGPDDRISLRVPIRVDAGFGPNWWDASKG